MAEQTTKTKNIPTVFIVFGATGDLMGKKIIPALFHLHVKQKLPKLFKIIGFSRRPITEHEFKRFVEDIIVNHPGEQQDRGDIESFIRVVAYQQGNFEEIKSYKTVAALLGVTDRQWNVCSNKLFYLAVPPQHYKIIFENLAESGLTIPCGSDEGWTRVIVEKPFGKDYETAEKLDILLAKLFKEEQIYRIDHYLAKEMLQNILSFRFSNNLFEEVWNNQFIERVDVKLLENIGVEKRGAFYDGIGALRDVGQNHLLQMLSLITMEQPNSFSAEEVRKKRAEILATLHIPASREVRETTLRAQYEGYRQIPGVKQSSQTETYFKTVARLSSIRWQNVPVFLESGKKLPMSKEIIITFKHPTPCLCPLNVKEHYKNKIIFSLEPREGIEIYFWSKKPGLEYRMEKRKLNFLFRRQNKKTQYVQEYEKLLLDCIAGNQILFLSTDEVKAMWKYIDPIAKNWEKNAVPLFRYKPYARKIFSQSLIVEKNAWQAPALRKEIGIIGLGKMGGNIAKRLNKKGWNVVGYNRTASDTESLHKEGILRAVYSLKELSSRLRPPKIIFVSLPAGNAFDEVFFSANGLIHFLENGDYVIDAGNSYYKDAIKRNNRFSEKGIHFIDLGISGGPAGALLGATLMAGGNRKNFDYLLPLFIDMAVPSGVGFFEGTGAGHFVKMIHNGIEYGMMQAIAEGFSVLEKSGYDLDLEHIADIYNHGSVVESRLIGWTKQAFETYGRQLSDVTGAVGHTGEGAWTVRTAREEGVEIPVIKAALRFRQNSSKHPDYTGQILSALRAQFGGHPINSVKSNNESAEVRRK